MATYIELVAAATDPTLKQRVALACVIAANTIFLEDTATANHAARLTWAKSVYNNPESEASRVLWSVLAQNKDATTTQIAEVTDASLQTAVDTAVAAFI
jgi:hypothetical protein